MDCTDIQMFHHSLNLNFWSSHNSWLFMGENVLEISLYTEFITKQSTFPTTYYWWSNSIWAKTWIDFYTWTQNQNCLNIGIVVCGFFLYTGFHLIPSLGSFSLQNCFVAALWCDVIDHTPTHTGGSPSCSNNSQFAESSALSIWVWQPWTVGILMNSTSSSEALFRSPIAVPQVW